MKYSVPYYRGSNFSYYDEVDEIVILYNKKDTTLKDFLEKYKHKTIIIAIPSTAAPTITSQDMNLLSALYNKYANFKLRFSIHDEEMISLSLEYKIPFFFENLVNSWPSLRQILTYPITDVYIGDELGFDLENVSIVTKEKNIAVRVIPYIAQSICKGTPAHLKFFIRPEDVDFYSSFVDVLEFISLAETSKVYYEVYALDKVWAGKLNELIIGADELEVDNTRILDSFAKARVKCERRCDKPKSKQCQICKRLIEVSETFKNAKIQLLN